MVTSHGRRNTDARSPPAKAMRVSTDNLGRWPPGAAKGTPGRHRSSCPSGRRQTRRGHRPIGSWVVQVGLAFRCGPTKIHRAVAGGDPMIAMPHLLFPPCCSSPGWSPGRWTSAATDIGDPARRGRRGDRRRRFLGRVDMIPAAPCSPPPLARPVRGHLRLRLGHVRAVPAHCVETPPDAPRRHPQRRSQPSPQPEAPMDLILNLLIICALIVVAPLALAMLLLTVAAAVTDVRSHRRMRRTLDELIRERP